MKRDRWQFGSQASSDGSCDLNRVTGTDGFSFARCGFVVGLLLGWTSLFMESPANAQDPSEVAEAASPDREGYSITVELPLIGDRDEQVKNQILRVSSANQDAVQRPIVVLEFRASQLGDIGERGNVETSTRGSQFERCLSLARFLTSAEASRVRLIAYLPDSVVGHAVLPVLACEEIIAAPSAELGRVAIDEPVDATIEGAYLDIVSRRSTLPKPVVLSMLKPTMEVVELELSDGRQLVATRDEANKLRDEGLVLRQNIIWSGGGQAVYSGQQMRGFRWVARTVDDVNELPAALGITGALRTTAQLPREWKGVSLEIQGTLNRARINQLIRSIDEAIAGDGVNLIVLTISQTNCSFAEATRLASELAELGKANESVYTLGLIAEPLRGPISFVALACDEVVLLGSASLAPDADNGVEISRGSSAQRVLADFADLTGRPLPLLAALADPNAQIKEYVHQATGKRAIFTDWQVASQADAEMWLAKSTVAGGTEINREIALNYHLVDSVADSTALALNRLGIEEIPPTLPTPWVDASIQTLLAFPWVPQLLLTIGFFAMMVELGNPGIGVAGFLSAICFVGFFWIEALNGNVEWLEVLLFVGGLTALAIEIFVLPGFGIFGIGGLLMVFVSVVLASQTFVWPTTSAQLNEVAFNLFWVACLALSGMIGLLFMHKQLERLPWFRWLTLEPADMTDIDIRESLTHREHLLGQDGITTTRLNPSGKAQFGNEIVQVIGPGKIVGEGVVIRVVEVRGNLVLVEEV